MSCAVQIILCKPLINQSMHLKFCYVIIKKINYNFSINLSITGNGTGGESIYGGTFNGL